MEDTAFSFVDVSTMDARLRKPAIQAPDKPEVDDAEVPDLLYAVQYFNISGKMIDCKPAAL